MLKHPDPDIQLIIEILEEQRDKAIVHCASLLKENIKLKKNLEDISKEKEEEKNVPSFLMKPEVELNSTN